MAFGHDLGPTTLAITLCHHLEDFVSETLVFARLNVSSQDLSHISLLCRAAAETVSAKLDSAPMR
jgi:hypothetical protein